MFNPMRSFKKMHHDKCIDGSNKFAPIECECFCYSKMFLPVMQFAIIVPIELSMIEETPMNTPHIEKIELRRLPGPPDEDGFYSYAKVARG